MGAFALYIPASVYYVNETMAPRDKFKGQAVMTATNTLGGVIGSLLGGFLLDHSGSLSRSLSAALRCPLPEPFSSFCLPHKAAINTVAFI